MDYFGWVETRLYSRVWYDSSVRRSLGVVFFFRKNYFWDKGIGIVLFFFRLSYLYRILLDSWRLIAGIFAAVNGLSGRWEPEMPEARRELPRPPRRMSPPARL